ncbi:RNA polymerase sigma factor [Rossellomorea sp. NPDC077527]|uniref:RNA polymerase sigma factor n=1 Tax=Rossellomorea sp. NPDC077527 TaxID=3364510 RepID=UPI0037C503F9
MVELIFDELEHTVTKLYRYCLKLTGSTWEAEDLVQETLLKVYPLKKQDPDRAFTFSFLYTVAKNLFIDGKRKKRESFTLHEEIYGVYDPSEFEGLIEILLSALPLQQGMLITLKDVFNYTTKEIAAMLRVSDEFIKTALHRSRKKLTAVNEDTPVPAFANPEMIQNLSTAIKQSDPSRIFRYYRMLETRHFKVRRDINRSVFHVIDLDGNVLEIASLTYPHKIDIVT